MQNLTIDNVVISKTEDNLYRINDLHKASGAGKKKQPSDFLKLVGTQELIAEIIGTEQKQALRTIQGGNLEQGTYIVKELVYAYAMWISPKFMLHVINTFDSIATGQSSLNQADREMLAITSIDSRTMKAISKTRSNAKVRENYQALVGLGILEEVVETRKVIRYRFTTAGADYSNGYYCQIPRFEPVQHDIIVKVINAFKKGIEHQNDLFIAKD